MGNIKEELDFRRHCGRTRKRDFECADIFRCELERQPWPAPFAARDAQSETHADPEPAEPLKASHLKFRATRARDPDTVFVLMWICGFHVLKRHQRQLEL